MIDESTTRWHHSPDAPPEHFCEDCDVQRRALETLASLEGPVWANDDKERPWLAQSVVREIARWGLGEKGQ